MLDAFLSAFFHCPLLRPTKTPLLFFISRSCSFSVNHVSVDVTGQINFDFNLKLLNPFAPEPPVTARADPGPFYPL